MHPSHFCPWFCSKTFKIRPSFVTSVLGGCASFVSMTVLSTFNRKPTLPTAFTNLSKICATSGPEFANNRMSSAKRRSTKLSRASPRSKPAFPISVLHCLKAHSRTAVNSRGLKTQPCRTPPVMEKLRLLPHSPMTSPSCSSYAFPNNHTKCSGTPCSRRATHNVGQCTRSNAVDKSKLTIHTVIPAAAALSSRRFAVNKCSSNLLPGRKPCCSSGCFASKISSTRPRIRYPNTL